MAGYHLTMKDILKRETFRSARVLAGEKGLDRPIKWTHILETKDFESLLNGGELILTTGINLELNASLDTYARLIDKHAAGICIEAGPYFKKLPVEIKQFADKHQFPVIVFEEMVKFVDITQDVHTHMINQHHHILSQLNELTKQLSELSLSPNGILKILAGLYEHFQCDAFFISHEVKSFYYPPEAKNVQQTLASYVKELG
ncbi:PucR family transcriptional regulator ligand-binding domain-containing protein [Virgibacillus kimchii]